MTTPAVRAKAELEYRQRTQGASGKEETLLAGYRYDPVRYIIDKLGWHPWAGDEEHPGQVEVLEAYALALRQQHERLAYEQGELSREELRTWQPGQVIQNRIRIEAGHTVGKTKLSSGVVSHFFVTLFRNQRFIPQSSLGRILANGFGQDNRVSRGLTAGVIRLSPSGMLSLTPRGERLLARAG